MKHDVVDFVLSVVLFARLALSQFGGGRPAHFPVTMSGENVNDVEMY
jgi:hypothetical protein